VLPHIGPRRSLLVPVCLAVVLVCLAVEAERWSLPAVAPLVLGNLVGS
jgi:hypothetical protein